MTCGRIYHRDNASRPKGNLRTCSPSCRYRAVTKWTPTATCKQCGNVFSVTHRRKFCTPKCRARSQNKPKRNLRPCEQCGLGFSGRTRYCPACRAAHVKTGSHRAQLDRCEHCGKVFHRRYDAVTVGCSRKCAKALMRGGRPTYAARKEQKRAEKRAAKRIPVKCLDCPALITRRPSGRCEQCYQNFHATVPRVAEPCIDCGKAVPWRRYVRKKRRCEKCQDAFIRKEKRRFERASIAHKNAVARRLKVRHRLIRLTRLHGEKVDPLYIYERDNWRCGICGKKVTKRSEASLDHIIPLSKGGGHTAVNLQLAHRLCNSIKRDLCHGVQLRLIG